MEIKPLSPLDQNRLMAFVRYRHGLALLSEGQFTQGWVLFEERLKVFPPNYQEILFPTPDDPTGFANRNVVVIGDPDYIPSFSGVARPDWRIIMGGYEIMFAQYYPALLSQNPKSLRVLADPRLCPLLKKSFPQIAVAARPSTFEGIYNWVKTLRPTPDIVLPLASLGKAFIKTHSDVPFSATPWIRCEETDVQKFRTVVRDKAKGRIPVAFSSWGAGISGKSINPGEFFAPFRGLADRCLFINFQYAAPEDPTGAHVLQAFSQAFGENAMATLPFDLWDKHESTAAMLAAIRDEHGAAVMIPNYTEQIACGIGIPIFKPLHGSRAIKYGFGRAWNEDVFFYPWTRTYLQEEPGQWAPVLEQIARDLARFVAGDKHVYHRHNVRQFKPA